MASMTRLRRRLDAWFHYHRSARNGEHVIATRGFERAYMKVASEHNKRQNRRSLDGVAHPGRWPYGS